jgi:hypothetical protein
MLELIQMMLEVTFYKNVGIDSDDVLSKFL